MSRTIPIMLKREASAIVGGLTQTSKMPCKSFSLPTIACKTGARMAKIKGSVCSKCYATKGLYKACESNIEPAQIARLFALDDPLWIDAMVRLIGADSFFRWHDSGDIQSLQHLEQICEVARRTPGTGHWLPTREYAIVARFVAKHGRDSIPRNLVIRLSAMFPDRPVVIPASLRDVPGIAASNVHTATPIGERCTANERGGKCGDCRSCWDRDTTVSYRLH